MRIALSALLFCLPVAAQGHEIWIERDGVGAARIYLGEPGEPMPPGGDPEFAKLKAPHLLSHPNAVLVRRTGFLEAKVPPGDVRAWDDTVFAPWGKDGQKEAVVYYARAGRAEAVAKLAFELVPLTANGSRFALLRENTPVAGVEVTVFAPDRSKTVLKTDAAGMVDARPAARGRYLLVASKKEDGEATLPVGVVQTVYHITTTSFVVR
ncbi:DUF4198 domain-containing protein [Sphingomonas sp. PB2P19]|uniref:DUF4198 domain-containing protein n=1 Tax=Sphingomonas rhamnosi TaxID=3096156 RepID=UPI002FC85FEE